MNQEHYEKEKKLDEESTKLIEVFDRWSSLARDPICMLQWLEMLSKDQLLALVWKGKADIFGYADGL